MVNLNTLDDKSAGHVINLVTQAKVTAARKYSAYFPGLQATRLRRSCVIMEWYSMNSLLYCDNQTHETSHAQPSDFEFVQLAPPYEVEDVDLNGLYALVDGAARQLFRKYKLVLPGTPVDSPEIKHTCLVFRPISHKQLTVWSPVERTTSIVSLDTIKIADKH